MNYDTALLEAELAAYTPAEIDEFCGTLQILFDAAEDNSTAYAVFRHRVESRLSTAIKARLAAKQQSKEGGDVIPFPRRDL